jgi:hypoxanthine-guanine phosphoribosyltransferase
MTSRQAVLILEDIIHQGQTFEKPYQKSKKNIQSGDKVRILCETTYLSACPEQLQTLKLDHEEKFIYKSHA